MSRTVDRATSLAGCVVRALLCLLSMVAIEAGSVRVALASSEEVVRFPSLTGDVLNGALLKPPGPGPFPAVVALHGCGGLRTSRGELTPRHAEWGRKLVERGFVVLFPDSFGSRGLPSQCLVKDRKVRATRERIDDANGARRYLQSLPFVEKAAVHLLGWSNGGSTVLWSVAASKAPRDGGADFRSAVAIYPGCRQPADAAERNEWQARLPVLILIGGADTWTPAAPCSELVGRTMTAGQPASIIVYPEAVHDFDVPNRAIQKRTGLAFTGDGSGEALTGTDVLAKADAQQRVPEFFSR